MWRKSEERKLRETFRNIQEEPTPAEVRERLQADIDARFVAPGMPRIGLLSRALRPRPLVAATGAVLVVVLVGALLTMPRSPDLIAAVLDAMERVSTVHTTATDGETWFSREHGMRSEYGGIIRVSTPEATWEYDTRKNKLTISDPDPEKTNALLQELSGTQWLEILRNNPSRLRYRVDRVLLDGMPAMRIDAKDEMQEVVGSIWIDTPTMRVVAIESWDLQPDGSRSLLRRNKIEYDIPIDVELFTFEPPEDATVVDCRLDSELREVIDEAIQAVKTLPMHEIGEEAPVFHNEGRRFDRWHEWEGWRQNGVGYRVEDSWSNVRGGNPRENWYYSKRDGYIREQRHYPDSFFTSRAHAWLWGLKQGRPGGRTPDAPTQVIREEENGRRLARLVAFFTFMPPSIEKNESPERSKQVLTLDLEAKRLVERELYVWLDDEWRLAGRVRFDYLEELPDGIFDLDPPPGVKIDDLRTH